MQGRVWTIPNVLSMIRLVLLPVFLYLLLVAHHYGLAVGILMFSGVSDWADGKIARLVANQSSRLAELLDPLVDRIYMVVRSRGVTALPVTYIGKAATFALMSGFPLILLGQWDSGWSRAVGACGWAFVIWGTGMYLWSAVLYLLQARLVVRELPRIH
jgi:cardiolipin synthase